MLIMFSGPVPWISLMRAEPPAVSRKETLRTFPWASFPSQFPESALSWSKDFCAADWAKAAVAVSKNRERAMRIDLLLAISFCGFGIWFGGARLPGLFGVFGFDKSLQVGEAYFPEIAVLIEPGVDGAERVGIELVDTMAAFAMLVHEMGAAQQAEMLGDCGPGNGKGSGNFTGGLAAAAEQIEHCPPRGIGESL